MSFVDLNESRFHYELDGPPGAPVLVLSNSLGTDLSMWDPQLEAFAGRLRVLRYDTRGHGASTVTPGPYRMEQLAGDVVGLLDALKIERAMFCGLSLGGATGIWLAAHASTRFDRVVLCNTGARIGTPVLWNARFEALRQGGMTSIADSVMQRWFTKRFRDRAPEAVAVIRGKLERQSTAGYIACGEAVRDHDERESISTIRIPTLVTTGTHDLATPAADGRFLADQIPGARYVEFDTAHLSNIEAPAAFTDVVLGFLMNKRGT